MGLIVRNIVALLGSQLATWIITLVMVIIVPRQLGDAQYGRLNFATAFVSFFGLLAAMGSTTFITKEVARDASRVGSLVFNALVMGAVASTLLSAAAIVVVHALGYPAQTCILVSIACAGMAVTTLSGMLVAGLQGLQRMGRSAIWMVVQVYASSVGVLAVLAAHKGLVAVALVTACAGLISLVGNGALLLRNLRQGVRLDLRLWKALAIGGLPFLLWNGVLMIYGSVDTPMLSYMTNDRTVGWYTLAYKLISVPAFFGPLVVTAFFPSFSANGADASPRFAVLANRAIRMIVFATAPMAAGVIIIAADVISLLHYPTGFAHTVPLIRILALHVPVVGLDTVLGAALMASDRQKSWVMVGCLAAMLNPLLNLIAIPITVEAFGNGAVGASIVTVATELFMMAGAIYLRPRGVLDWPVVHYLFRCILACVPILMVGTFADHVWLPAKIVLGVVAYGVASLALRTVTRGDVHRGTTRVLEFTRLRGAVSAS